MVLYHCCGLVISVQTDHSGPSSFVVVLGRGVLSTMMTSACPCSSGAVLVKISLLESSDKH